MSDLNQSFDSVNRACARTRSQYHLTLGAAIKELEAVEPSRYVVYSHDRSHGPGTPDSYRGYYSDLALEPDEPITAGELLSRLRAALGAEFTGYKGGEFTMTADTPLWCAEYGRCGPAVIAALTDEPGPIVFVTRDVDAAR